jgi:ABC-2 type transport system permease protein
MTFLSGGMIADLGSNVREIGKFTINHWANEAIRTMMAGGKLQDNLPVIGILSSIAAVLLVLSVIRFRKAVALA